MRSKTTSRRRNEEGMALLFALGFLAMLLVLGLGFVTTSLLSQKIAVNNATRVQARMLARSAAARAALAIMLYNDQSIVNDVAVGSYDGVCSYDQVKYNDNGNVATGVLNDQLKKGTAENAAESILKYKSDNSEVTGEKSNARWIYFYDSASGTDGRKIVGRAAFQALPSATQWLSLYGVTGGAKLENDLGVVPYDFRWGRGIEELCLNKTKTLEQWSNYAIKTKIPFVYDTLYNTYSDFFTADTEDKKNWIENWFVEGRNTVIKDAFPVEVTEGSGKKLLYYNRFNIGDLYCDSADRNDSGKDNWYDRFKAPSGGAGWTGDISAKKNSSDALDALTAEAIPYQENDADDTALDAAGLPFLKRIGNEAHSFGSLELLRKQIAANFNDYCDTDSIPTGDIKASQWSITDSAKFPQYTGNEKTLYINEVAGIIGPVKLKCEKNGDGQYVPLTVSGLDLKMFLELVNMYDRSDSPPLLDPTKLEALMAVEKLAFNIAIRAKYTGTVTYTVNSGAQTRTATFTVTVNDAYNDDNFAAKVDYAPASPVAQTVSFSALANGYSIGGGTAIQLQNHVTNPDAGKFTDAVKQEAQAAVPSDGAFVKYEITEIEASYQLQAKEGEAKLKLAPVLLRAKSAVTGVVGAKDGVDFVRFDLAGEMELGGSPAAVSSRTISRRSAWSTTFRDAHLLGGIEALDPRQNLNPRVGPDAKSDWLLDPKLIKATDWNSEKLPSMTLVSQSGASSADHNISAGLVNSNSSPKKEKDAAEDRDVTVADKELAEDPAWRGDDPGMHVSTAHIRNSPMVSPWEVGLIHRGRAWQTLNIKRAGGFGDNEEIRLSDIKAKFSWDSNPGTKYDNGDGAILEYTKMSTACRAMGKIPLTMLRSEVITKPAAGTSDASWNGVETAYNKDIVKMLFDGIRQGQTVKEFFAESKFGVSTPSQQGGTAVNTGDDTVDKFIAAVDGMDIAGTDAAKSELKLRCQFLNSDYGASDDDSKFTFGLVTTPTTDAVREELIGKTVNLLAVTEKTPPNVFRVVVVAQTIRDVGGIPGAASDLNDKEKGVPITKLHNGDKKELNCLLGRFEFISDATDWENNTYFDEITGEVKALVTLERVPALDDTGAKNPKYGRIVITKIEYID